MACAACRCWGEDGGGYFVNAGTFGEMQGYRT